MSGRRRLTVRRILLFCIGRVIGPLVILYRSLTAPQHSTFRRLDSNVNKSVIECN